MLQSLIKHPVSLLHGGKGCSMQPLLGWTKGTSIPGSKRCECHGRRKNIETSKGAQPSKGEPPQPILAFSGETLPHLSKVFGTSGFITHLQIHEAWEVATCTLKAAVPK